MRQAFITTLIQLAEQDKDLYILTADMGFGVVEQFATKFPRQYINVGVAEQNMIGVATGLALGGKKVFCYSIANFPTVRCLEQIRNDVCYHNLPVCIVSGGAGLWYGSLGMTHWAVEDIAVMRALPNMAVVSPNTPSDVGNALRIFTIDQKVPAYLRFSKSPLTSEPSDCDGFRDVAIIATGGQMVSIGKQAAQKLAEQELSAGLTCLPVIKPLDERLLEDIIAGEPRIIITIEEHSRIGGLGSAVAEVFAGSRHHPPLVRMGTRDEYPDVAMSYEELLRYHHLTVDDIVKETIDGIKSV